MTISAIRFAAAPRPRSAPRSLGQAAVVGAAATAAVGGAAWAVGGSTLAMEALGAGLAVTAAAAGIGLAALACAITAYGKRDERQKADCIIVLGTAVRPDGTPAGPLAARIENAERLYREGWAPRIIFTGGRGKSGFVESEVSRDLAQRHGLPAQSLLTESCSHNTYENFLYARDIMRANGWKSCLISTDPFHERRSVMIAREMGLEAHPVPATQSPGQNFKNIARECVSTLKYMRHRWRRKLHRIEAAHC